MKPNYQAIIREMFRDAWNATAPTKPRPSRKESRPMNREEIRNVCTGAIEMERVEISAGLQFVETKPLNDFIEAIRGLQDGRRMTSDERMTLATFAWVGFHATVQTYAKQNNIEPRTSDEA